MSLTLDYLPDVDEGALIRIFGRDEEAMRDLSAAIEQLQIDASPVLLGPEHGIAPDGCELRVCMSSSKPAGLRQLGSGGVFAWTLDESERANVLGLLEPFRKLPPHDIFQWLRDNAGDVNAEGRPIRLLVSASERGAW